MLSCPPQLRPRTSVAEPMNCWPVGSSAQCASEIDRSLPSFSVPQPLRRPTKDRKSTRLNSSHLVISYAVFCLKKKIKSLTQTLSHLMLSSITETPPDLCEYTNH